MVAFMRRTFCLWMWFAFALVIIIFYGNINNFDHLINKSTSPGQSHDYHKIQKLSPPPPVNSTVCELLLKNHQTQKGYVIGLNYWEQLNMAVGNLYALVQVAADWNGVVVKPFTSNSRLFGLPNLRADERWSSNLSSLPISVLFDSSHFLNMPCSYNLHPLVDFDDFISNGFRKVTILHFIFERDIREKPVLEGIAGTEIKHRLKTDGIFVCDDILPIHVMKNDIMKSLNSEAKKRNAIPFKLLRYFCIDASIKSTPKQLAKQAYLSNTRFSVLVVNWRGLRDHVTVSSSATGEHKSQRQFIVNTTITNHPTALKNIIYSSPYVLNNASYFLADISGGKNFIGIHIRSEKLGLRETRIDDFVPLCLREAIKLRDLLKQQSTHSLKTIVITDSGVYGSDSCQFCKGAKHTKEFLDVYGIQPVRFNPTRYEAPSDSGFVGLVEMNALLQAHHLILVGGGAFQKQLAMRMRENIAMKKRGIHHQVYMVCWDDQAKVKLLKLRTYHKRN